MPDLKKEVMELRERVKELEETLNAIRSGEVDAIVVSKGDAQAVYTLEGTDHPYQSLIENIQEGALTLSRTGMILYCNSRFAEMVEMPPDKIPGTSLFDYICPDYLSEIEEAMRTIVTNSSRIQVRIRQGSSFLPVLVSMNQLTSDENAKISVVITDRKRDDEGLRLQARMLDAVGDAVIATDPDRKIIYWNAAATAIYGWKPEEVIGHSIVDISVPVVTKKEAQEIATQLSKGDPWAGEYLIHHRDGHAFPVYVHEAPVFDDVGKIMAVISTSHDISEQRQANDALQLRETELRRSHELLNAVTTGTDVLIAVQDMDFRYIFFNQTYRDEIKRLTGKDITLGASMVELFAEIPEEQKNAVNEWSRVLKGETVNKVIEFGDRAKNRKIYRVLHTSLRDAQGTIVGAGEVAFDITRQYLIEDSLRETKEYLDNLITYANAPIIVWDPQFRITLFNRAFEHLTGRKAEDVLGQTLSILLPDSGLIPALDLIKKAMDGERWDSVEMPIINKDGGIRIVLWNSGSIFGADGRTIVSTIAQGQDITDRKKTEGELLLRATELAHLNAVLKEEIRARKVTDTVLKKTLSLLNASLESTADGIVVIDTRGKITNYNQNFVNMWDIPPVLLKSGKNPIIMAHIVSQLRNPEEYFTQMKELQANPERESFDMIEFIDGRIFERFSKPQKIGDKVVGRVWSFRDITDRRNAEANLIASLAEKEVLLREIHHRVKNNLQLVSSLLDLTLMNSTDTSTNSALTDVMLKIQTMAQIHKRLYESKQFEQIGLSTQIRDQIAGLSSIYSTTGHEITYEINSQEINLPVDRAIPCALALNEILSNSYKHAFEGRKHGSIEIIAVQDRGQIEITVRDNGIGLPGNFDVNRINSLGMILIKTLVQQQLHGSFKINSRNGTEIQVKFPARATEG